MILWERLTFYLASFLWRPDFKYGALGGAILVGRIDPHEITTQFVPPYSRFNRLL